MVYFNNTKKKLQLATAYLTSDFEQPPIIHHLKIIRLNSQRMDIGVRYR